MQRMLEIKSFIFGPFQTNTYVVDAGQGNILLVDPACAAESERRRLKEKIPDASHVTILATHGHLDHLWGAAWACQQWGGPVWIHPDDIPMAQAMQQQYDLFGVHAKAEPFPMKSLNEATEILYGAAPQILHTPGHTPGSVCFYWPEHKTLLSGDTLFCRGYGRTDLPGGNWMQLIQSLKLLFELPGDTLVLSGHGENTTIIAEKQ